VGVLGCPCKTVDSVSEKLSVSLQFKTSEDLGRELQRNAADGASSYRRNFDCIGAALKELQKWQRQFVPLIGLIRGVNNDLHYMNVTTPLVSAYVFMVSCGTLLYTCLPHWHRRSKITNAIILLGARFLF
jgi:hypothetical protein